MWIFLAVVSYLLLAVVSLIDKYLLTGPLQNPKTYVFYIGMLGLVVFLLIPFGFLEIPALPVIAIAFVAGVTRTFALLALFSGLRRFETSRIVPAIGGGLPLFTALLILLLAGEKEILSLKNLIPFVLLVAGTVIVSMEKRALVTLQSLKYSLAAAFFFSSFFVLSKFVYEAQPFLSALIWLFVGGFVSSLFFLAYPEVRQEVFGGKAPVSRKMGLLFVGNQTMAGSAVLLQNLAVALAPFGLLAFVGALAGTQYALLFLLAVFLSAKFSQFPKERITKGILAQKALATASITAGLALLAF